MSVKVGCWFIAHLPPCLGHWGVSRLCTLLSSSLGFDCKSGGFSFSLRLGVTSTFNRGGLYPDGAILSEKKGCKKHLLDAGQQ